MYIGIDTNNQSLVYEGASTWGQAIWPAPFLIPATIMSAGEALLKPCSTHDPYTIHFIFREDAFDPVSRVRRGRLYQRGGSQPQTWQVYPHPALPSELSQVSSAGVLSKWLFTFSRYALSSELRKCMDQFLVLLGAGEVFTIWTLINIEKMATGEELITLKARQSIGALPRINYEAVPAAGREQVADILNKLAEDIYRAGPESVIDRARESARIALSVFLQDQEGVGLGLDLGKLIVQLVNANDDKKKYVVISAAGIIRRFHSRGKTAEQESRQFRPIREQDAELAVQCVGAILCDLGWADWR